MNKSNGLRVIRPGVQSSLQDLGRFGVARYGLSQGGAMDLHAHCWANKLLGNVIHTPTLEVVVGMASFRAEGDLCLAIAGADMQAAVDDVAVGNWTTFNMLEGQLLELKPACAGMRAYLAVKQGFDVAPTHGSVSTVARNQLGGMDGGFVKEGDVLPATSSPTGKTVAVPYRYRADYDDVVELRVIESYQNAMFTDEEKESFYQSEYTVSQESDRMGMRLVGAAIAPPGNGIISEAIALGAIQVPPDGQPIVLLNDRQTLGGYPKMGCVAKVDLAKLAQARPGAKVTFKPTSLTDATEAWLKFIRFFEHSSW